tara:strand:- start:2371 stop:2814 length:444 start_codon:yes stop_codon:yes gene_type:complete
MGLREKLDPKRIKSLSDVMQAATAGSVWMDTNLAEALGLYVSDPVGRPGMYRKAGSSQWSYAVPAYTTDLSAALALVGEKLGEDALFHMGCLAPKLVDESHSGHRFYFCLPEAEHVSSPNDIEVTGHTLPLAAVCALLSALKDQQDD